jgi:malate dehydrogenase (oxaloacetate-decarboxylating)
VDYRIAQDENGESWQEVALSDYGLITHSFLNKGMSFTDRERDLFNLHGLLPPQVATLSEQKDRSYAAFKNKPTDIEKYIYLRDLQDSNETLFYSLVCERIEELTPIIYTPTVGLGCQRFSHIYRRPRGLFISYPNRHRIDKIFENKRFDSVEVIVVSDGEHILGLGDQGAGGMGIPIGKLALYTACGGIHPMATLPILLDTGTDNADLLNDPLYIGYRSARVRGKEYDAFVDAFVEGVKKRLPHVLLQWEDFSEHNAFSILKRYENRLCTFNGDIQGTGAIVIGTLLSAIKETKTPLSAQRIVIAGAGAAGCGTALLLMQLMKDKGIEESEALSKIYLVDEKGWLLTEERTDLSAVQKRFSKAKGVTAHWRCRESSCASLEDVVNNVLPTVLIGVAGQPKMFTETLVRTMSAHVKQPIIFALSNPTSRSEAVPSDLLKWTEGRVIMSTGSPFGAVMKNGRAFLVDQANNNYIFPGVGLGVVAVKAKAVTDEMFTIAAEALAEFTARNADGHLLPPLTQIREVSLQIALAVAKEAMAAGLSEIKMKEEEIERRVRAKMWTPAYLPYRKMRS